MDQIIELIKQAFTWLKNITQRIVKGIMSFARHILNRFRSLNLNQSKHTPFIANGNSAQFKEMLKNAPVKKVGVYSSEQVFSGVFDEETDEIIHAEILGADELDATTKQVLGNEPIVVLS